MVVVLVVAVARAVAKPKKTALGGKMCEKFLLVLFPSAKTREEKSQLSHSEKEVKVVAVVVVVAAATTTAAAGFSLSC